MKRSSSVSSELASELSYSDSSSAMVRAGRTRGVVVGADAVERARARARRGGASE